jgi:hypothetical protein
MTGKQFAELTKRAYDLGFCQNRGHPLKGVLSMHGVGPPPQTHRTAFRDLSLSGLSRPPEATNCRFAA